jgi:hypothetical protein
MKVIRHQRVRRNDPAEAADNLTEKLEEAKSVVIVEKDLAPIVAARGDVVDGSGILDAHCSCHAPEDPSGWPKRRGIYIP